MTGVRRRKTFSALETNGENYNWVIINRHVFKDMFFDLKSVQIVIYVVINHFALRKTKTAYDLGFLSAIG